MDWIEGNCPAVEKLLLTGGECTLYPEFLQKLLFLAKRRNLFTQLETNGSYDFEHHPGILEYCDRVTLGLKAWDPDVHRELTGQPAETAWRALEFLSGIRKLDGLQILCLPDQPDTLRLLRQAGKILGNQAASIHCQLISTHLLPTRRRRKNASQPERISMQDLERAARQMGFVHIELL